MPLVPADLSIACRWIIPMTERGRALENYTLLVRDGRILDLLPHALAADRYRAAAHVDRRDHLLMPGLVNAHARTAGDAAGQPAEGMLRCIAAMLKSGTTCFRDTSYFPRETALTVVAQGMRTVIGLPIDEAASPWAADAGEYLTRALEFRDEFRDHPFVGTAFAPASNPRLSDATFGRIATLANELDAGVFLPLHGSLAEIEESLNLHGARPLQRMQSLGLLTPALGATDLVHVTPEDIDLARRSGIALTLCPAASLRDGFGAPPIAAWAASGLRLGIGGVSTSKTPANLWSDLGLLLLLSRTSAADLPALDAWEALACATRGGAAVLGLEAEIGSLETGKWADLCCLDLRTPYLAPLSGAHHLAERCILDGGRDLVSDVWVAGRHLLNEGAFTRSIIRPSSPTGDSP